MFRLPSGKLLPDVRRPGAKHRGPELLEALILEQLALGLDDDTAFPGWDGRTPDYAACVASVVGGSG